MKASKKIINIVFALAILLGPWAFAAPQPVVAAEPVYTCLPTCEENDARFLTIAGAGLQTLADESINLQIAVEGSAHNFEVSFFDGDTSSTWDNGSVVVEFTLYADPLANGLQDTVVKKWSSNDMPDNDWFSEIVLTGEEARSPSGNFFYLLVASPLSSTVQSYNNFKVRTDGLLLTFRPSPFAFMAGLARATNIVYPQYPSLTPTTYNGDFDLFFYVSQSTSEFITWDGDLDFGSFDGVDLDTDDPDTPNEIPVWAGLYAVAEGVAVGIAGSTGAPRDDASPTSIGRRSPSVFYTVTDPNGNVYSNTNPSGNLEWEQFTISVDKSKLADYHVDDLLPSGIYKVHLQGMDLGNLNAWRSLYPIMGVCEATDGEAPVPCKEILLPFLIGDTVFVDTNGDGIQDGDEPGIPGVMVNLLDSNGNPVLDLNGNPITAITDANGWYQFEVEGQKIDPITGDFINDGEYTAQVDASNFSLGGALHGATSTTGGELQTNTVVANNVLTYDFGYLLSPGVGSTGFWKTTPEAWPVEEIEIGGNLYSKVEAIAIMSTAGAGDKTYDLFAQLVAAKLNVIIGNLSTCIEAEIAAADAWMAKYPVGSKIKANSKEWKAIEAAFIALSSYNTGLLCAPHP